MKSIEEIHGLTIEKIDNIRVLKFDGEVCPLINRRVEVCEEDTSYNGCVTGSWETYQTPIGVVERVFEAHGAELERTSVSWRLVREKEITDAQMRFCKASDEMTDATKALKHLCKQMPRKV